jgi:16S rRNA (guanine1516-N2)-methyltransferase
MHELIAVATTTREKQTEARKLAEELKLNFIPDANGKPLAGYQYLLLLTPAYLGLQPLGDKKQALFFIDFLSGKMRYRCEHASLRKELLARAMGCKPSDRPSIIDATAGLGRDGFILAALGFEVTLIERSPILFALLRDALSRAKMDAHSATITNRLHLIQSDAITWLRENALSQGPEVIYLDPMFPERQKSSSVKKEMIIMQELLGKDEDSDKLLQMALTCASKRVVIKRPRLAAYLSEAKRPHFSLVGKHSRFDVYLCNPGKQE